jgi:serine protease Do
MLLDRHLRSNREQFPNTPKSALEFFDISKSDMSSGMIVGRTAMEFAVSLNVPADDIPQGATRLGRMPSSNIVEIILRKLVDAGFLTRQVNGGGMNDRYIYLNNSMEPARHEMNKQIVDFIVYGFPYVMDAYSNSTFQIVAHTDGIQGSGTAFACYPNCLLTAAHCLRDKKTIQIIGFKKNDLDGSRIFLSAQREVDCAMIVLPTPLLEGRQMPLWWEPEILEEIILIGYPNIPTLLNVQIAEKANVSTILRGGVSRAVVDIFKTELLLITAPVRGGFSGGPVINSSGAVVGMISRQPFPQTDGQELQRYDAAGFGLAIPTKTIATFVDAVRNDNTVVFEECSQNVEWLDG